VARILRGQVPARRELRLLRQLLRDETSWFRELVCVIALSRGLIIFGRPVESARALARAAPAWRGYLRLMRRKGITEKPDLLVEYEAACAKVLAAFEPPRRPGGDPVAAVVRAARALRPRRRGRRNRTIDAIDAVITLARSTAPARIDRRVAREVAAMLGARVLFRRRGARWLSLVPQAVHTLSTGTILRLARVDRVRAFRVRPKPEFWRPEQRRPGGVMVFPVGKGLACIGRRAPFTRRDLAAVRAVLRLVETRLAGGTTPARVRRDGDLVRMAPPLASEGLIGESAPWRGVLRMVRRVAESSCSVVLLGETGTGKERIARALHAASLRSRHAFVPVNCGALPPTLLGSELFGHIRGAFTGADRPHEGLFVRAHRGTLFLDEAADMPAEMQVALLRVLEEKEVRPVGSTRTVPVDVRIVTASARDLAREVAAGRFREDLYHRLDVVRIALPPLRDRRDDIPLLAAHLLSRTPEQPALHPDALALLMRHDWPGNVRELDNVLRACAVLAEAGEISPALLSGIMEQRQAARGASHLPRPTLGPRAESILHALESGWLSAGEIATRLGVSVRTVNRDLSALVAGGWIESAGEARARRYGRSRTTLRTPSV
jgi:DNA-binding NtrC family response regulator